MDRDKIEFLTNARPNFSSDQYLETIVDILTVKPRFYHPIKRFKFNVNYKYRIRVVLSVYARELIEALK